MRGIGVKVVTGGASISSMPWLTWVDIVKDRYNLDLVNTASKGLGNEAIILRTLYQAKQAKTNNVLCVVMLTNIDKWDWYVDTDTDRFENQKHGITKLDDNHEGGFWSTGNWFPDQKQHYHDQYYNQNYFAYKTLKAIQLFVSICDKYGWLYKILFDSPILSNTQTELDHSIIDCDGHKLFDNELCSWMFDSVMSDLQIFTPGLIGFCEQNNIAWQGEPFHGHPGPLAHYLYTQQHVYPALDAIFDTAVPEATLQDLVNRMQADWPHRWQ